ALRGDLPSGMAGPGDFVYASELVAFIREHYGNHFHVEVGCYPETHPQADHAAIDMQHFANKVKAGADGAITQYFFNADGYFRFVDEARRAGVEVPIVPGIMPISNFAQLRRFSDICGAEIPRWITTRMQAFGDDVNSIRELGADVVSSLCRRLLDGGAPGLHIYTLNRAVATTAVVDRLQN
ncbi:MAG: methylenetetrahydrofolate reductase, partial [Rhodanobacteraceae bacterium]